MAPFNLMSSAWLTTREAEEAQRREQESENEARMRLQAAVRTLGETQEGLDFLRWLLNECHVFEQSLPTDQILSAWQAGRRAFGLKVLGLCIAENLVAQVMTQEVRNAQ